MQPGQPKRADIEPAVLAILSRHSAGLLATARRYSATPEDAEDAYQRGIEILLKKAPTTAEQDLLPWLRTVVKHEAYAVRKSSTRALPTGEPVEPEAGAAAWTDERAERYERLRIGAEAMAALKPQEIRCLLLKAEGLSYQEIATTTGFSYTKVNRCLTEGRRAFLKRVASIESGAECERLEPLISKAADGEASPDEMRAVRPHLKSCLACRATLREYRATPARLAGLIPPVAALASPGAAPASFLGRVLESLHERFAALPEIAGAKAAAVAASAVVITGGGAAGVQALHHDPPPIPKTAFAEREPQAATSGAAAPGAAAAARRPGAIRQPGAALPAAGSGAAEPAHSASPPSAAAAPSDGQSTTRVREPAPGLKPEFDPGSRAGHPAPARASSPPAAAGGGEFGP